MSNIPAELARIAAIKVPGEPMSRDQRKKFEAAPCFLCGYNGEGYFNPSKHACAEQYQAAWLSVDAYKVLRRDAIIAKQRALLEMCWELVRDMRIWINTNDPGDIHGNDTMPLLVESKALLAAIKELNK